MKALVGALNQEKALVGAFSVITNLRVDLVVGSVRRRRSVLLLVTLESVSGLGYPGLGWAGLGWLGWGGWEPSRQAAAGVLQHHIPLLTNTWTQYSPHRTQPRYQVCRFSGGGIFRGLDNSGQCAAGMVVTAGCNVVSVSPVP